MTALALAMLVALGGGEGFFEEAMAIDEAGGRVALVRAGGGGPLELEVRDVEQGGAVLSRTPLGDAVPAAIHFTRGGVLVVEEHGAKLIDGRGKVARRFGPADHVGASRHGDRELIALVRGDEVTLVDLARPPAIARRSLVALGLTAVTWRRGFTVVGGRRTGRYDRVSDQRAPDRQVVVDLVTGHVLRDEAPEDLVAAAKLARERQARPGADGLVFLDGDKLMAATADDRLVAIELTLPDGPQPLVQETHGDEIVFSVETASGTELYRLAPGAGAPRRIATLPANVVWRAAASRVVVLRGGGRAVEIVEIR